MATCPSGHESASDDFCDVCGIRIGAAALSSIDPGPGGHADPASATGPPSPVPSGQAGPGQTVSGEACPRCGSPRDGQFCEGCGWNFAKGTGPAVPLPRQPDQPPAPGDTWRDPAPSPFEPPPLVPAPDGGARAAWSATVTADREYYEAVREASGPEADSIDFPAYCPERRFRLAGGEVRIGRRSASRGIEPEIDLTGPPADPGVSRLHAVLISDTDGTWSVLDPGSANGTLLNGSEIQPNQPVKLREGDRVNLGAWTLLVVSRDN